MNNSRKDRIYADKLERIDDFVFDDKVADVFEDMISRSVPGYDFIIQIIPIVANKYLKPNTNCYDLGCSVGDASIGIAENLKHDEVKIFAIDSSQAMISKLDKKVTLLDGNCSIMPKCTDVLNVDIKNASFVILNYTLQFIHSDRRKELIANIFSGLNLGGALFLSEKIVHQDEDEENILQEFHEEYKRANTYSEIEISQKREALENVLIRDTNFIHINRLKSAGFTKVYLPFKYLNFVSYLAVK